MFSKKTEDNPDNPLKLEVKWVKSWFPHGFHGQILWFLPHGVPSFSWATAPMGTLGTTGTSPHKKKWGYHHGTSPLYPYCHAIYPYHMEISYNIM